MALVTLIRHGQASFGAADYDQLSPLGFEQLTHLGNVLHAQEEHFDILVRGGLKRHKQSADAFLKGYREPLEVIEQPNWNEFDHRSVMRSLGNDEPELRKLFARDGKPNISETEVLEIFMRAVSRWQSGAYDTDYQEPWSAFVARVEQAWESFAQLSEHKRIAVITSGGPIALTTMGSLGMPASQMMEINARLVNAGVSRFLYKAEQKPKLLSLNEHHHVTGRFKHLLSYR